jgi:hypothetical protein
MSDNAETQHDELDRIAAKLLQTASELPPGSERDSFLNEIGQIRLRLSALKAKGKGSEGGTSFCWEQGLPVEWASAPGPQAQAPA